MADPHTLVIVGGTSGISLDVARDARARGDEVVVTGRDATRADVAASLGGGARGLGIDLAEPETIGAALTDVERVDGLVLAAIERDAFPVAGFDIQARSATVTLKLIGYRGRPCLALPDESGGDRDLRRSSQGRPVRARPRCPRSTAAWSGWSTRWRWNRTHPGQRPAPGHCR